MLDVFPEPRFRYRDLNLVETDVPSTIIGDITECSDVIDDESFDIVVSNDVFEHIDRPWLAAQEIRRILRPGGVAVTWTLWSWRNHPCPIDYWRFSPECLEFLFDGLRCLEKGFDLRQRRQNEMGRWASGNDSVPVDAYGGWLEHWAVYCVCVKGGETTDVVPFKRTDRPQARYLRMDTQGTVTNPDLLSVAPPPPPPPDAEVRAKLDRIASLVTSLQLQIQAWEQKRDEPPHEGLAGLLEKLRAVVSNGRSGG